MVSFHFPRTSCHPHALLSFFLSLSVSVSLSFSLSFFFSADNRQPSHAVHLLRIWRRPSESPKVSSNLTLDIFHLSSPAYPSFLSSVIVCSYQHHSLHCCLAGLQSFSSKPDLITSCYLSFSSVYVFNFCSFALSLSSSSPSSPSSSQPFSPKPALHFFLLSIFFSLTLFP